MPLDLGNIIGTLGTEYIRARYGGPMRTQSQVPTVQPTFDIPGIDLDLPFVDIEEGVFGGRRKRTRRRRRLLTPTDFNDLALLKTLTGNNDAFKAAVIKAVRR